MPNWHRYDLGGSEVHFLYPARELPGQALRIIAVTKQPPFTDQELLVSYVLVPYTHYLQPWQQSCEAPPSMTSVFAWRLRKLRSREVRWFAQAHKAYKWLSYRSDTYSLNPKSVVCPPILSAHLPAKYSKQQTECRILPLASGSALNPHRH